MCWGLNTLETVTDAHMKIAHNPLDLVLEARVSELHLNPAQTPQTPPPSTQGSRAITQPSTS